MRIYFFYTRISYQVSYNSNILNLEKLPQFKIILLHNNKKAKLSK